MMKMNMFVSLINYVKTVYFIMLINIMKMIYIAQKNVIKMFGISMKKMKNGIEYVIQIMQIVHQLSQKEKSMIMFQIQ